MLQKQLESVIALFPFAPLIFQDSDGDIAVDIVRRGFKNQNSENSIHQETESPPSESQDQPVISMMRNKSYAGFIPDVIFMDFVMGEIQLLLDNAIDQPIMHLQVELNCPYYLGEMHGPEATRQLRQELKYRGFIVGVTGNVTTADVNAFLQSGVDEILAKPLKLTRLLEVLRAKGFLSPEC